MASASDPHPLKAEISAVGGGLPQTGHVCAVDRGMLRVETPRPFEQGQQVLVRVGGCAASGSVVYSVIKGHGYRTAIALRQSRRNRRREWRVPFGCKATITLIAGAGEAPFEGAVTNMSSSGLGIRSQRPFRPMDTISVQTPTCIIFGEVVHCVGAPGGMFQSGVRIAEFLGAEAGAPKRKRSWLRRLLRSAAEDSEG